MRITALAIAAVGLLAATSAVAGEKVSDVDYLKANRCRGLAASDGVDTKAIDAFIKAEGRTRPVAITEMAQREQTRAKREGANPDRKSRVQAELAGACVAYLQGQTTTQH